VPRDVHEKLSGLLARYVKLMFSGAAPGTAGADADSEFNPFRVTAGVCIDYCVITRDTRLLFEPIYERFVAAKKEVRRRRRARGWSHCVPRLTLAATVACRASSLRCWSPTS
jgi:hypothetical protein